MKNSLSNPNKTLDRVEMALKALQIYHRHEVWGLSNIPQTGPAILALNHSLATYDGFLLGLSISQKTGRKIYGLGDRLLFKLPLLKDVVKEIGIVNASFDEAKRLLDQGEIVAVAPGGMREALKPSKERYQILWDDRQGFARLAMETGHPLILAACPQGDRIFDVYNQNLSHLAYNKFKIPLPLFRGLGPTLIPRPVKLAHYLSAPLFPPKLNAHHNIEEQLRFFHRRAVREMQSLMKKALKISE